MREGSGCATCTFRQQIGPVEDNPTIALTLNTHFSYQYSMGIVYG